MEFLENHDIYIKLDSLRHFLRRNQLFSIVNGKPQDIKRIEASKSIIDSHFKSLTDIICRNHKTA